MAARVHEAVMADNGGIVFLVYDKSAGAYTHAEVPVYPTMPDEIFSCPALAVYDEMAVERRRVDLPADRWTVENP